MYTSWLSLLAILAICTPETVYSKNILGCILCKNLPKPSFAFLFKILQKWWHLLSIPTTYFTSPHSTILPSQTLITWLQQTLILSSGKNIFPSWSYLFLNKVEYRRGVRAVPPLSKICNNRSCTGPYPQVTNPTWLEFFNRDWDRSDRGPPSGIAINSKSGKA